MKFYSKETFDQYRRDIAIHGRGKTFRDIEFYYSWVIDVASKFNRDYDKISVNDLTDLIQSGNEGLVRAWNNLNWKAVEDMSDNDAQAWIWNYLKKGIQLYIQEELDKNGSFVKVPMRTLKEARSNHSNPEDIYVELFPKFFDDMGGVDEMTPWENELLYELLMDILHTHILNNTHRSILMQSFGIDTWDDKPVSGKKLSKQFNLSEANIRKIKQRMVKLLRENEEIKEKIENYLQK